MSENDEVVYAKQEERSPETALQTVAQVIGRWLLKWSVPSLNDYLDAQGAERGVFRSAARQAAIALGLIYLAAAVFVGARFGAQYSWYLDRSAATLFTAGVLLYAATVISTRTTARLVRTFSQDRAVEVLSGSTADKLADLHETVRRFEEELAERNATETISLTALELRGVKFFEDGDYRFAPNVNVLLGKNGYGKTLLLRALAAMIQCDNERTDPLFAGRSGARLTLRVTRNGNPDETVRDRRTFKPTVGRIPLLAIPDVRFLNRAEQVVTSSSTAAVPLARSGAQHFLTQEPYKDVLNELMAQLSLDYLEGASLFSRKFDRPLFQLLERVVRLLTEDETFAFHEIIREGRTGFRILVRTAGTEGEPLPIQAASQGTLSVVAIFGLIYSFLASVDNTRDANLSRHAIVIIDELDAHLHPSWQQKVLAALTSNFPNVQFIISAHSPLIVAGCDQGEVTVLRRTADRRRFRLETRTQDFMGAGAGALYRELFEVEDIDRLYLEYAAKATVDHEAAREREIAALYAGEEHLNPAELARLDYLLREKRLVSRASDLRQQRLARDEASVKDTLAERDRDFGGYR
jgi:predicted ATPase